MNGGLENVCTHHGYKKNMEAGTQPKVGRLLPLRKGKLWRGRSSPRWTNGRRYICGVYFEFSAILKP